MALSKADKDFIKKSVQDARDEILDAIGKKLEGYLKRGLRINSPKGRRKASKTSSVKKELKDARKDENDNKERCEEEKTATKL